MFTCFEAPNHSPAFFPQSSHEKGNDGLPNCYNGQAHSNARKVASARFQEWLSDEARRLQAISVDKDFINLLT